MKTCPVCRKALSDDNSFCPEDGTPLLTTSRFDVLMESEGLLEEAEASAQQASASKPPPLSHESDSQQTVVATPAFTRDETLTYSSEDDQVSGLPTAAKMEPERRIPETRHRQTDKQLIAAELGALGDVDEQATKLTPFEKMEELDGERSAYVGKLIDNRYLVQALIGRGGMGAVYRVEQIHLRKEMAVKLLHENLVSRKQLVSRFAREARAISRLSSPHTVTVFDFGRWGEVFYLVMELLEGQPMDEVLQEQGPLSAQRTTAILIQMCDSLSEAHEQGIVHRDLKPENIILLSDGPHPDFVKVLDFGLAKVEDLEDPYTIHSQKDIFGTPHYMSPEQIRPKRWTTAPTSTPSER